MTGRHLLSTLAISLLCACGADLDSHDGVADAAIELMEDMADVLEGIDSKEAADAAAGDLEDLAERGAELGQAMEKLGKPDKETEKELEEKYEDRMKAVSERMGKAMQKSMMYIAQSEECQKAMERVGEKMSKLK